ncbi:hypothetical protein ACF0H5_020032 [Mactra antiquata]
MQNFVLFFLFSALYCVNADECTTRLNELENKLDVLLEAQAIQKLEDNEKIKELEAIISRQNQVISQTGFRLSGLENTIEKQKRQMQPAIEGQAAFSAVLDHDLDGVGHQTIVFNKPIYNKGNYYDNSTGVFTAPLDGVYLFIYFIGNRHDREVDAQLMLNGLKQNEAVAEGVSNAHDTQGGNSAILQLTVNDKVWLATSIGDHVEGQWWFSSFTGALLYPY